ncbi:DNA-directed RNA polymerase subunit omega [Anaerostipes sp. MSJ-23]|uniref:DNA-directed RNA polymerase subunit omega n=1 Tax=unclassified Anaerostipes TaxID=2635253 RepID=UPI001C102EC8|nr:DNA-directed RNA polymerase subunit omega [Anaerostipes sp. MSJ-23]MBU5460283.1 DNA-directed RNA polymerase subunit omega [Anaerostipes sp. MSJ-23]
MLHPSYTELMKVINGDSEDEKVISSRYSVVLASAKRARQIIGGDIPLVAVSNSEKPLSIAVEELRQEKVKILGDDEEAEE